MQTAADDVIESQYNLVFEGRFEGRFEGPYDNAEISGCRQRGFMNILFLSSVDTNFMLAGVDYGSK